MKNKPETINCELSSPISTSLLIDTYVLLRLYYSGCGNPVLLHTDLNNQGLLVKV